MLTRDLLELPRGDRYQDEYGGWLAIFKEAAESAESITYTNSPPCWAPLLLYLGNFVESLAEKFEADRFAHRPCQTFSEAKGMGRAREYVEHVCSLRPELVDALWKSDCEWATTGRCHQTRKTFTLTTHNGYYRPEIQRFLSLVDQWEKPVEKAFAVVTNCSADKPYPADVHEKVIACLPSERWHLVIATGVLGAVPQELWASMPLYDCGIPNFWRCMTRWERYLRRANYLGIVIYTEFYSRAVMRAVASVAGETFVASAVPAGPFFNYLDFSQENHLSALRTAIDQVEAVVLQ